MAALLLRGPALDAVFAASGLMASAPCASSRTRASGCRKTSRWLASTTPSSLAEPQRTTVRQPVEEKGSQMTRLLPAKLAGEAVGMSTILQTELVVRASA
jgi:DNA-binding LacI/PurR family transcriptional regulator